MPSFKIEICTALSRVVDIEADTKEDALKIAREKYRNEEIVLDSDDYVDTEFIAKWRVEDYILYVVFLCYNWLVKFW